MVVFMILDVGLCLALLGGHGVGFFRLHRGIGRWMLLPHDYVDDDLGGSWRQTIYVFRETVAPCWINKQKIVAKTTSNIRPVPHRFSQHLLFCLCYYNNRRSFFI